LLRAGTRTVFSLSGNQIMPVYDAAIDARIDIVHVRHEGAAVHMADAWGRLTGEPGIALVTGGPGHANAIGALYTALAAEAPLVLLSGHAPLAQLGMDAFQEMRQAIRRTDRLASWTAESGHAGADMARAIRTGRPAAPTGPLEPLLRRSRRAEEDAVQPAPEDTPSGDARVLRGRGFSQVKNAAPIIATGPRCRFPAAARVQRSRKLAGCRCSMESPRG
jgi:acetolactate synthase-1/2/3 large subunit